MIVDEISGSGAGRILPAPAYDSRKLRHIMSTYEKRGLNETGEYEFRRSLCEQHRRVSTRKVFPSVGYAFAGVWRGQANTMVFCVVEHVDA
ncbi:hypothetical protein, partial [Desulfococcus sp.]|uniref:hypothetical protein n=1 Tax=Desulfococcus sp. TaxID=2025834 RepID=UPI003D14D256